MSKLRRNASILGPIGNLARLFVPSNKNIKFQGGM